MHEYVAQSNIERFQRLIGSTSDAVQLATLENLLKREVARLAALPVKRDPKLAAPKRH